MAIELENSFTVPVGLVQAWDVLLDVERIAPCMPGASVTSVEGDEVAGQVKVKLGPLALTYKGTAKFTSKDEAVRSFTLDAAGKETKGAGTAAASVLVELKPTNTDDTTMVLIHTSLTVTGRPAQFGRSLLPEVSGKLIAQFASNLEALIGTDAAASVPENSAAENVAAENLAADAVAAQVKEAVPPAAAAPPPKQEESLDAFRFIVVPVLKRVVPVVAAGAVLFVVIRRIIGRRRS
jgi:carbon monoxide dehydrogenase subunit G